MSIVKGKAMWAAVQYPNTTFEPTYCIDLVVDKKTAELLKKEGLKIKEKDGDLLVKFKRKVVRADGQKNKPPIVVDAQKKPFDGLIGNGSDVKVQFRTYTYNNRFGEGTGADLQAVQILKLVEFGGATGDGVEFDVEDGFVSKDEAGTDDSETDF